MTFCEKFLPTGIFHSVIQCINHESGNDEIETCLLDPLALLCVLSVFTLLHSRNTNLQVESRIKIHSPSPASFVSSSYTTYREKGHMKWERKRKKRRELLSYVHLYHYSCYSLSSARKLNDKKGERRERPAVGWFIRTCFTLRPEPHHSSLLSVVLFSVGISSWNLPFSLSLLLATTTTTAACYGHEAWDLPTHMSRMMMIIMMMPHAFHWFLSFFYPLWLIH